MDRRNFIVASGATFALASCSALQSATWLAALQSISQLFVTVEPELVGQGFNANSPISFTVGGVPTTTTMSGVAAMVQKLVATLDAASTASQGQSVLVTIETYVNALTPIIYPVLAPFIAAATPGGGFAIGVIVANIPLIETALNFTVNLGGTLLSAEAQKLAVLAPANGPKLI